MADVLLQDINDPWRPWQVPRYPLFHERVAIIANSSVAWARAACELYAVAHDIPVRNIINIPLGTNPQNWNPGNNAAIYEVLMAPLRDHCAKYNCNAVLAGPTVPPRCVVRGAIVNGNFSPTALGYPPLRNFAASAKFWDSLASWAPAEIYATGTASAANWGVRRNAGSVDFLATDYEQGRGRWNGAIFPTAADRLEFDTDGTRVVMPLDQQITPPFTLVNGERQVLLDQSQRHRLPYGRIGWFAWNDWTPGSEQGLVELLVERYRATLNRSREEALALPHVFLLGSTGQANNVWGYLRFWMAQNLGMDTAYRVYDTLNAAVQPYSPVSGQIANPENGSLVNYPAFMLIGSARNPASKAAAFAPPYSNRFLGLAGAGGMAGPSYGFTFLHNTMVNGAGLYGETSDFHIGAFSITNYSAIFFSLLRGMSPLEASLAAGSIPNGDPLYRPYPGGALLQPSSWRAARPPIPIEWSSAGAPGAGGWTGSAAPGDPGWS